MRIGQKLILGFVGIALLIGVVGYVSVNEGQKALQTAIGKSSIMLAEEILDKNFEVILGSYGYVYNYMKNQKLCKVVKIPKELVMKGNMGAFDIEKTFFSTLKTILIKGRQIISSSCL